jgi:hypothetical protein
MKMAKTKTVKTVEELFCCVAATRLKPCVNEERNDARLRFYSIAQPRKKVQFNGVSDTVVLTHHSFIPLSASTTALVV